MPPQNSGPQLCGVFVVGTVQKLVFRWLRFRGGSVGDDLGSFPSVTLRGESPLTRTEGAGGVRVSSVHPL
jgi:hypothetical protein